MIICSWNIRGLEGEGGEDKEKEGAGVDWEA
jgi:hypothetical protein